MHIHSCAELGSVAFDLFLWGKKDCICVFGRVEKKNMAHKEHSKFATGNQFIWEGSQAKNREAPNNRVGINCPDFVRRQRKTPESQSLFSVLFSYVCYGNISLVYLSCYFVFGIFLLACSCQNRTESQSFSSPIWGLTTCQHYCQLPYSTGYDDLSQVLHSK